MRLLLAKKTGIFYLFLLCHGPILLAQTSAGTNSKIELSRAEISDSALLDKVQRQSFTYFWDFAHPVSAMARERSNSTFGYGNETVTIGGTGFGVMAIVVATERKWIGR